MIKKISVERLRTGMYVHELCGSWMSHPFWLPHFALDDEADIERIRAAGISEVYIDTSRGLDDIEAVHRDEVQRQVDREIAAALSTPVASVAHCSRDDELPRARQVQVQAQRVVRQMMHDVRLGKAVSLQDVDPVVEAITSSVMRNDGALLGLVGIKQKDNYTFQHSVSVCTLLIAFCRARGLEAETMREIGIGGLLHDIGKMQVPDAILNKPDRLTDAEFEQIRQHPLTGHAILEKTAGIGAIPLDITRHHHERLDGRGYPDRLAAATISEYARMAAIVDVYDAITAERCYHRALPATEALRRMWEWSPSHLDRGLVQAFIHCVGIYPVGSLVLLESGLLGVVIEQNSQDFLSPQLKVIYHGRAKRHLEPSLLDLSASTDRIVSAQDPELWPVDPQRFLQHAE